MKKVYLCGPIAGCTDDEASTWRDDMKIHLGKTGAEALDPMDRDYRGVEELKYREIVDLDKRDVREADVILVNYSKPSVGTSMEVFYAWMLGKPIIIWHAPGAKLSPWMVYHSTATVTSRAGVTSLLDIYLR